MDTEGPRVQGEGTRVWPFQSEERRAMDGGAGEVQVQTQGYVRRAWLRCLRERVRVNRCHSS